MPQRSTRSRWPSEVIKNVQTLRKGGLSYGAISKETGISKSTLFSWIKDIKRPGYITNEDKKRHLKEIQPLAVKANKVKQEKRLGEISIRVKEEIKNNNLLFKDKNYLKSLISMLYWAEGTKAASSVKFTNTDPTLVLLFVTLLRKSFPVDESKFRIRLHLHHYHPVIETRRYWSDLLNIPTAQFGKIFIKKRSKTKKFRKNFKGICFVVYYDSDLKYEIMQRAYRIAENVPVA